MKYQAHIKTIQADYFKAFAQLKIQYPSCTGKELWELLESRYDFEMYSTYDSFRTSLCKNNKTLRKCKNQSSTSV